MPAGHHENFPVGSLLLPRHLRWAVQVLYRFARYADNVADEGEACASARMMALGALQDELDCIAAGRALHTALMRDLACVIARHHLPLAPFYHLLSAFRQDVQKTRYQHFDELMDYCQHSANPIGRLMLALYGEYDAQSVLLSDAICSALQLINFLQDIAVDWRKGRVYLPQEDLLYFKVSEAQIARGEAGGAWGALMGWQIERVRQLLHAGAPLGKQLSGRFGLEVRLIVQGGERILQKLQCSRGDVFSARPILNRRDWIVMMWRAF